MADSPNRLPDFIVSCMTKDSVIKGRIGAAWKQDDGTISIKLDPFVVLQGEAVLGEKMFIKLFHNRPKNRDNAEQHEKKDNVVKFGPETDAGDDIPF